MTTPYISSNEAKKRQNVVLDCNPEIIDSIKDGSVSPVSITVDLDTTEPHHLSSFKNFKDKHEHSPNQQNMRNQKYIESQNELKSRSSKLTPPKRAPYRNSTNHQSG